MTATTLSPARPSEGGSAVRRVVALAKLEMTMLVRNKTALFNALALGPLMVVLINSFQMPGMNENRSAFVASLLGSLVVFAIVFAGYYNLCTTAVARREELMLKRLTVGELRRWEVLTAMAAPSLSVILAQVVLGAVAVTLLVGAPTVVNPLLMLLGLLLGFGALAVLGYATAIITRTVEAAQITTLLPLAVLIFFSGATFPFALMPDALRTVAELTPLAATNELMTLGLTGTTADGGTLDFVQSFVGGLQPTIVLLAWIAIGGYLVQRMMPWEPRR
ncbi:ABC transporter permease [Pseudactinotalea suaedae]|uniref:ABC transporter permease n=1 Tax=Pseudactinotalea suaedae TaxID=1524924 RepID=UPI0012E1FB78|nr:ABC transporter permease [Pseudactinotalea suaedae]